MKQTWIYEKKMRKPSDRNHHLVRWALVINIILLVALILAFGRLYLLRQSMQSAQEPVRYTVPVEKKIQPQSAKEATDPKQLTKFSYQIKVENGLLAAYTADGTCYMETEIRFDLLPESVQMEITNGKGFETEEELLSFLESYSS